MTGCGAGCYCKPVLDTAAYTYTYQPVAPGPVRPPEVYDAQLENARMPLVPIASSRVPAVKSLALLQVRGLQ